MGRTTKRKSKLPLLIFLVLIGVVALISNKPAKKDTVAKSTEKETKVNVTPEVTSTPISKPKSTPTVTPTMKPIEVQLENILSVEESNPILNDGLIDKADEETSNVDNIANEDSSNQSATFYDASFLKGRGLIDVAGEEPNYVNTIGFAAVYINENLENNSDCFTTPWIVPVYLKVDDNWEKVGTIDHKSKIGIISQELLKENGKEYQGYLEFQDFTTGTRGFINVKNFVTIPYWEREISEAADKGYVIASFKQVSKYTPVYKDGKKAKIQKDAQVLILAKGTYFISAKDRVNYQILGIVFEMKNKVMEPQYVFFNKNDLSIVY